METKPQTIDIKYIEMVNYPHEHQTTKKMRHIRRSTQTPKTKRIYVHTVQAGDCCTPACILPPQTCRTVRLIRRPCIECGLLTQGTTRCTNCNKQHQKQRNTRREHYKGDYQRLAASVRINAVNCWICNGGARANDPFTADHLLPSEIDSVLLPAHRSCNSRRGADRKNLHG